jgi:(E)-4-hydroxy-3-methylbut-2-enyl-diphosphate synthase
MGFVRRKKKIRKKGVSPLYSKPLCPLGRGTSEAATRPLLSSFLLSPNQKSAQPLHQNRTREAIALTTASPYTPLMSSIRPWRDIARRQSRQIMVGNVPVGGNAPISVQTMTNTLTSDAKATIDQIRRCEDAGVDIIRVSCPDVESTTALKQIVRAAQVPIVADIHFHYKRGLEAADAGAACLRINPGNIGSAERVNEVVNAAKANGCAIRIGVNAGSLEKDLLEKYGEPCPEALIESALDHIKLLQDRDFHEYKVAVKASDVFLAVAAYMGLAEAVDCPLHLGITEAGGLIGGTVKSALGIGNLLWAGIGDTIRVSLSAEPEEEVRVGYEILKTLGLRTRGVRVVSCPSCARQGFDVIRTVQKLEDALQHIKTPMSLSVLGCVVNGPGEARETDIGITGGGNGKHMVYLSGVTDHHVEDSDMIGHIVKLVEAKAAEIDAGTSVSMDTLHGKAA